jgi:hypothetical protein
MMKRGAALAILATLAWGSGLVESRVQQDELQLSLNCKPPSFKVQRPELFMNGSCALPDGVILKVNMSRVAESVSGNEIQPVYLGAGSGTTEIEGKKFSYDAPIDGPGKLVVQVALIDDMQEKHLVAEMKKKAGNRRNWQFELLVWGDDLIPQLPPKLNELHTLIAETRDLTKRFEKASASQLTWQAEMKPLVAEGKKLQAKLDHHELKAFYPAAVDSLHYTVRNFVNNAPYYTFEGGKFTGASDYHADNKKVQTFRGEEFNWDNLKRYIEEALPVGGREFCLWMIKDLRRTAGQMRPEIQDAVKSQKAAPGVETWAERLSKATISELDGLEVEIRGTKVAAKDKEGDKR